MIAEEEGHHPDLHLTGYNTVVRGAGGGNRAAGAHRALRYTAVLQTHLPERAEALLPAAS